MGCDTFQVDCKQVKYNDIFCPACNVYLLKLVIISDHIVYPSLVACCKELSLRAELIFSESIGFFVSTDPNGYL